MYLKRRVQIEHDNLWHVYLVYPGTVHVLRTCMYIHNLLSNNGMGGKEISIHISRYYSNKSVQIRLSAFAYTKSYQVAQ